MLFFNIMHIRHRKILDILLRDGEFSIKRGALELGVTEMTLRRDLRELEKEKQLLQVKGGATFFPVGYFPDGINENANEKFCMARALANRILPAETLFIGTGSTAFVFASYLARLRNRRMTVVTHSLAVATALYRSSCRVIMLGGELRPSSLDLTGAVAEKNLREYHVEYLVTSCDGALSEYGFYTSDPGLANLEKNMIAVADKVAVIAASKKFAKPALTLFASCDDVDLVVSDSDLSDRDCANLRERNIEVIKAE